MLVTVLLLLGFAVPVVMAVACVVIARHLYPRGQRFWAGLLGSVTAIALPVLVILTIRDAPGVLHDSLSGQVGPVVSIVLFAGAAFVAPAMMLWFRSNNRKE